MGMKPGERVDYTLIDKRPKLSLPNSGKIIIWPILALEVWNIERAMARMVISPPQGQPMTPDHPNWSWHEYGMRVGFWRIKRMLDDLGIRPTVTLNAKVCEEYPEVAGACLESGWEFNAHSYEQLPMHKLDDERSVIEHSLTVIENFTGSKPKGWFGPGLTQTYDTLDHLSHAGIEYIGDWVLDDQPIWARTEHQPIAALPYNYELHDIVMMNIQNNPSHIYRDRALDYFDTLYSESDDGNPRVIALAMHTYLSGSPHRISYVRETFETLMKKPDVVCCDGLQIYDWFTNQIPAPKN